MGLYGKYWVGLGSGEFDVATKTRISGGRQFIESRAYYPMPKIGFDVAIGGPGMENIYVDWRMDTLFGYFVPANSSNGSKNYLFYVELITSGGLSWHPKPWVGLSLMTNYTFYDSAVRDRGSYDKGISFVEERWYVQAQASISYQATRVRGRRTTNAGCGARNAKRASRICCIDSAFLSTAALSAFFVFLCVALWMIASQLQTDNYQPFA